MILFNVKALDKPVTITVGPIVATATHEREMLATTNKGFVITWQKGFVDNDNFIPLQQMFVADLDDKDVTPLLLKLRKARDSASETEFFTKRQNSGLILDAFRPTPMPAQQPPR